MVKNSQNPYLFMGKVIKLLKSTTFLVELENKHQVMAYACGKIVKEKIRIIVGDQVTVQVSPYDNKRAIIKHRHRVVK